MSKERLVEKKPPSVRAAVAEISRNPDFTNPDLAPYPDMRWSKVKKRWLFIDHRTPAEKKLTREAKRHQMKIKRIWEPVSRRIPHGWYKGVTCNVGWKEVIFKLVAQLDWVWKGFDRNKWKPEECWLPVQVKEKFGTLRFYVIPGVKPSKRDSKRLVADYQMRWEIMRLLITHAEGETSHVCEDCGERGERRTMGGCIATSCQPCYDGWLKDAIARDIKSKYNRGKSRKQLEESMMDDIEKERRKKDDARTSKGSASRGVHARRPSGHQSQHRS